MINKNLLLWAIIIIIVVATYISMFFLGRNSIKAPIEKIGVKEVVKYDTIQIIKRIYINRLVKAKSKVDSIKTYEDSIKTYEDRIVGDTLGTKYDIYHSITDSQKTIQSWWKINIEPISNTIIKTVIRDSIQTKINTIYLKKPFLSDPWFYISLIFLSLIIILNN